LEPEHFGIHGDFVCPVIAKSGGYRQMQTQQVAALAGNHLESHILAVLQEGHLFRL